MWLAESYLNRFARSASLNDAFEADRVLRRVINMAPEKQDVVRAKSLLGALLSKQFQLTGEPGLLEESIVLLRLALDETPRSHPDRPAMQSNLDRASLLLQRSQPDLLTTWRQRRSVLVRGTPVRARRAGEPAEDRGLETLDD